MANENAGGKGKPDKPIQNAKDKTRQFSCEPKDKKPLPTTYYMPAKPQKQPPKK